MHLVRWTLKQRVRLLTKHTQMQSPLACFARLGELASGLQIVVPAQTILGFATIMLQPGVGQSLGALAFAGTFSRLVWLLWTAAGVTLGAPLVPLALALPL